MSKAEISFSYHVALMRYGILKTRYVDRENYGWRPSGAKLLEAGMTDRRACAIIVYRQGIYLKIQLGWEFSYYICKICHLGRFFHSESIAG